MIALRRLYAWIATWPAWAWAGAAIAAVSAILLRRELRARNAALAAVRDSEQAERRAAVRADAAGEVQIERRDAAEATHQAAAVQIDAEAATITKAAANGDDALAAEVNATFGAAP